MTAARALRDLSLAEKTGWWFYRRSIHILQFGVGVLLTPAIKIRTQTSIQTIIRSVEIVHALPPSRFNYNQLARLAWHNLVSLPHPSFSSLSRIPQNTAQPSSCSLFSIFLYRWFILRNKGVLPVLTMSANGTKHRIERQGQGGPSTWSVPSSFPRIIQLPPVLIFPLHSPSA